VKFGAKLRTAFATIAESKQQGKERLRIFLKVKEKLEDETERQRQLKEQMITSKTNIALDAEAEMQKFAAEAEKAEIERRRLFEEQQEKDKINRIKNELMDQLFQQRQIRAREVLQELNNRGIKKVGKDKIQELERKEEDLDYDTIMNFYQNVLKREKEAYDIQKNKKVNDVEIWARALKEEESIALKDYCQREGNKQMENIRKAIQEKHAKELTTKKNLMSASSAFASYKQALLNERNLIHQNQLVDFATKRGKDAKE
jgi:hypothetical protein